MPSSPAAIDQMASLVSFPDSGISTGAGTSSPDHLGPPRRHHEADLGRRAKRAERVAGRLCEPIDRKRRLAFAMRLDQHRTTGLELGDATLNGDIVSRSEQAEATLRIFQLHENTMPDGYARALRRPRRPSSPLNHAKICQLIGQMGRTSRQGWPSNRRACPARPGRADAGRPKSERPAGHLGNPPEPAITHAVTRSASSTKDQFSSCASP